MRGGFERLLERVALFHLEQDLDELVDRLGDVIVVGGGNVAPDVRRTRCEARRVLQPASAEAEPLLARRFTDAGMQVVLAAGDTFRAAAIEQLGIWATRSGADIIQQQAGADPGAVVFDAVTAARSRRADVVIIDTAGRLHSQAHLMDELKKVKRVIQRVEASAPHEVLLVLDANQGQNALTQATQFHQAVGVTGLVLTKLDGTAKGGIVIAIARKLGLPIRFIGVGEQAEDFGEFDARAFATALVSGNPGAAG